MPPPDELTLQIPGLTLRALAWGPPGAEPVLGLHGWLDNAATYTRLAPMLPSHRIVAVDLPGHGHSDHRPAGVAYHFVDWIPDVVAVLDALGWKRASLMGHSMGAGIAALVAGTCPDRIHHLTLLEGLGPLVYADEDVPTKVADFVRQRRIPRRTPPPMHSLEEAAGRLRAVTGMSSESARVLVERGTVETGAGFRWRTDPRLRHVSPVRFTERMVLAFFRRIAAPTVLVRATEGWPVTEDTLRQRAQAFPSLKRVDVAGGHHVHLDHPERVAEALASSQHGHFSGVVRGPPRGR